MFFPDGCKLAETDVCPKSRVESTRIVEDSDEVVKIGWEGKHLSHEDVAGKVLKGAAWILDG